MNDFELPFVPISSFNIIVLIAMFLIFYFGCPPYYRWARSVVPFTKINNIRAKKLADLALAALIYTAVFVVAFAAMDVDFSPVDCLITFAAGMAVEYFWPMKR